MINLQDVISATMISTGAFFMFIGGVGIIRLPDFFSRTHAVSKSDALGIMLVLAGLALHLGWTLIGAKLIIALIFVALANPTAAHALAKSAIVSGLKPWFKGDKPD